MGLQTALLQTSRALLQSVVDIPFESLNLRGGSLLMMSRVSGCQDSTTDDCGVEHVFELHLSGKAKEKKMKEIIANKHNASVNCYLHEQTNALPLYGPLHPNSERSDHIPDISARFDAMNVKNHMG